MKQGKVVKEPTLAQQAAEEKQAKSAKSASGLEGVAAEIWNEIKDKEIDMFALPNQIVAMHAHPVPIEPSNLYVILNSSAALPSLETTLGKKYTVELVDRFVVVSRAVVAPTK